MAIVVQKYGGSSVATPDKLKRVAKRVIDTQKSGHSVVVVVSAMANTTDDLLSLANQVSNSPDRRELDMLLTTGERISMALLSMAIRDLGSQAISFTGSQAGIITNDRHIDARIIEVRPIRVQDELARGNIVIVAGYQGMSYKREITTLGRGGSDTTAIALAAALGAEWCEICSDVDGVYTTDPRTADDAQRIPEISYEETRAMAENGAKVLNSRAVEFAAANEIAIYARATEGPLPGKDPTTDGTVVRKSPPREPGSITGIACQETILLIQGETTDISILYDLIEELGLTMLRTQSQSVENNTRSFSVTLSIEDLHQTDLLKSELKNRLGDSTQLIDNLGSVSAIGTEINIIPSNLVRFEKAISSPIHQFVSSSNCFTAIIPASSVKAATQRAHAEFF